MSDTRSKCIVVPASMLYRSTNPGFWRLAVDALSMAWLQYEETTSSTDEQVCRSTVLPQSGAILQLTHGQNV